MASVIVDKCHTRFSESNKILRMIVREIFEIQPPRFSKKHFESGINEMRKSIESVTADNLIAWYAANGRESDKSVSKAVNSLILQNLSDAGWDLDWSYYPNVKSNHATFEASKVFQGKKPIRFAMDVASRHSNEALGYLIKGQLAKSRSGHMARQVDGHILLAYSEKCLAWGRWNGAIFPFERLIANTPLVQGLITNPIWIFGIDPPENLRVSESLAGTLKLDRLNP